MVLGSFIIKGMGLLSFVLTAFGFILPRGRRRIIFAYGSLFNIVKGDEAIVLDRV